MENNCDVFRMQELLPAKGVPSGGTTDQVLSKKSLEDYDTEWRSIGAGTFFGTCSTAASAATKVISEVSGKITKGTILAVRFSSTNTYNTQLGDPAYLSVNGESNIVYYNGSAYYSDKTVLGQTDRITVYMFDGTYWNWIAHDVDKDTTYNVATTSANGLMAKTDKQTLIKVVDELSSIAPTEDGTSASQEYAQGAFFFRNSNFCKAKSAIAQGDTLTQDINYEVTTVAAELFAALRA